VITVFIRYQLDPFKRAMFEEYAKRWHEGTNNIAFALLKFPSLAEYESYRARLRADKEAMATFNFAEENKFILVEERTFLRKVAL
jgi:hypothetical protein